MTSPYHREQIENWVSGFLSGEAARTLPSGAQEFGGPVLVELLLGACGLREVEPGDVEEADLRTALLGRVAALDLPPSVRTAVPDLAATFLAFLETEGRLAGGRSLGLFVRALRGPWNRSAGGVPDRRAGPKVLPNAPCPCGSGVKYKRCCKGMLD